MTYLNVRSRHLLCGRGGVRTWSLFDDRERREFLGVLATPKRFVSFEGISASAVSTKDEEEGAINIGFDRFRI